MPKVQVADVVPARDVAKTAPPPGVVIVVPNVVRRRMDPSVALAMAIVVPAIAARLVMPVAAMIAACNMGRPITVPAPAVLVLVVVAVLVAVRPRRLAVAMIVVPSAARQVAVPVQVLSAARVVAVRLPWPIVAVVPPRAVVKVCVMKVVPDAGPVRWQIGVLVAVQTVARPPASETIGAIGMTAGLVEVRLAVAPVLAAGSVRQRKCSSHSPSARPISVGLRRFDPSLAVRRRLRISEPEA